MQITDEFMRIIKAVHRLAKRSRPQPSIPPKPTPKSVMGLSRSEHYSDGSALLVNPKTGAVTLMEPRPPYLVQPFGKTLPNAPDQTSSANAPETWKNSP
jgi:hypothetical protein